MKLVLSGENGIARRKKSRIFFIYFLQRILLFISPRKKTLEDNFTFLKLYFLNIKFFPTSSELSNTGEKINELRLHQKRKRVPTCPSRLPYICLLLVSGRKISRSWNFNFPGSRSTFTGFWAREIQTGFKFSQRGKSLSLQHKHQNL